MPQIIDCYHNDITQLVEAREPARVARKAVNRLRYQRRASRRGEYAPRPEFFVHIPMPDFTEALKR
jgi:hypothetical protein